MEFYHVFLSWPFRVTSNDKHWFNMFYMFFILYIFFVSFTFFTKVIYFIFFTFLHFYILTILSILPMNPFRKKEERIKSYFEDLLYGESFMLNEREAVLKVGWLSHCPDCPHVILSPSLQYRHPSSSRSRHHSIIITISLIFREHHHHRHGIHRANFFFFSLRPKRIQRGTSGTLLYGYRTNTDYR